MNCGRLISDGAGNDPTTCRERRGTGDNDRRRPGGQAMNGDEHEHVTSTGPKDHVPQEERCDPCLRWTTDGDDNTFCPDCGLTAR